MRFFIGDKQMNEDFKACFGSPTVFSNDSNYCKDCEHYNACIIQVDKILTQIETVIDVKDIRKRHNAVMSKRVLKTENKIEKKRFKKF